MDVVEIDSCANDLLKLRKSVAAFRPPRLVRRQVAGNNVRTEIGSITRVIEPWGQGWTEIRAATEVDSGIHNRTLSKVGIPVCGIIEVWGSAAGVATVAVANGVDEITSKADQVAVFSSEVQRHGSDFKTELAEG